MPHDSDKIELVPCSNCEKQLSNQATECPHCNAPGPASPEEISGEAESPDPQAGEPPTKNQEASSTKAKDETAPTRNEANSVQSADEPSTLTEHSDSVDTGEFEYTHSPSSGHNPVVLVGIGAALTAFIFGGIYLFLPSESKSGGDTSSKPEKVSAPPQKDASSAGDQKLDKPVQVSSSKVWQIGNTWTYRVKRRPGEATHDEASKQDFLIKLELIGVGKADKGKLFTFRRQGGIGDANTTEWRATTDCILPRTEDTEVSFCKTGDVVQTPLKDESIKAWEFKGAAGQAKFHPNFGLIEWNRSDEEGRTLNYKLVGWSIGDENQTPTSGQVLDCSWEKSVIDGYPMAEVSNETFDRYDRYIDWDENGGYPTVRTVNLTADHGFDKATALSNGDSTVFLLERNDEIAAIRKYPTDAYGLRHFVSPRTGTEVIHLVLAEDEDIKLILLRLADTGATGFTWSLQRQVGKADYFGAVTYPGVDHCIMQFQNRQPDDDRIVANFALKNGKLTQLEGGSLEPLSKRTYQISANQ